MVRSRPRLVAAASGLIASRKAKVTDLQLTVGVDEQIARLKITVEDIGGVDVLSRVDDKCYVFQFVLPQGRLTLRPQRVW